MDRLALQALANEHRIRILQALEKGPKTYSDIMRALGLDVNRDRGRFTYHLNLLRDAKLVEQDSGTYLLTPPGEAALASFEAPEPLGERHPSFRRFYAALGGGGRLIVALLLLGVGLYLFAAALGFWSWSSGNQIAFLLGLVLLLLGLVCLFLILHALPGGVAHRWERALLFALIAGIYGFFLSTLVVPPNLVLGLVPAGVLSFLGYQTMRRGTRTTP